MYKLKVGDRVVAKDDWQDAYIEGLEGVVVEARSSHHPGVSFKGFTDGHSVNGVVKDASGWYVPAHLLQLLDDTTFEGNV